MKKMTLKDYNIVSNNGWPEVISTEDAIKAHEKNILAWKKAYNEYNETNRPLRILAIHGSGRAGPNAPGQCGYAKSVSASLLKESLKVIDEIDNNIEVEEIYLTDLNINACWNCVAITSGQCGAPCDCHPVDDMHILYPKILRSDIIFLSTGVNQSAMSTRLKAMVDRMISLDGGFLHEEKDTKVISQGKEDEFTSKMMALAADGKIAYDQRLYGRVAAYFIASKDNDNPHKTVNHLEEPDGIDKYGYVRLVGYSLKDNFESYGFFHDPKYIASAVADPDIDYMYDHETFRNNTKAHEEGREVVRRAIKLAKKLKTDLPEFFPDRINRT